MSRTHSETRDDTRADRVADAEMLAGGRWASADEDYSEQRHAADYIKNHFDFDGAVPYDPTRFASQTRLPVATVRGFWLRETGPDEYGEMEFCVSLHLEQEDEVVILALPITNEGSVHDARLKWFLQTLGVTSSTVDDLLGRKVHYSVTVDDLATADGLETAIRFYNSYRTYLSVKSQLIGALIAGAGCLMTMLLGLFSSQFLVGGIAALSIGVIVLCIDVVNRGFDSHGIATVPAYQLE